MKELKGTKVRLWEGDMRRREDANRRYLMKLETNYLLRSYLHEAGRISGRGHDMNALGGWEDLSCQLRGHFLGHWLSAAALNYEATKDGELKAKTETILKELELCQKDNGGEWVCPIPEKYLYWIGKGKNVWAPQYNIHKLFMGLVDVYKFMKLELALQIADKLADWFYRWSGEYTREEFDNILDMETGGMLEVWADLLEITDAEKYKTLLERYYRGRLFEPLLAGVTEAERILKLETEKPEEELSVDTERQWGEFRTLYRTENQEPGINFRKLNEIGYEPYQIYFKVKR